MRTWVFAFVLSVLMVCMQLYAQPCTPTVVGINQIIVENLYVVHSNSVDSVTGALRSTSNIYVLRGCQDSVWIFGSGYGEETDIEFYRPSPNAPGRGVAQDAADVDSVIRTKFGFSISNSIIQFVVPHYHLDHFNREILHELFVLGYDSTVCKIYVHTNDHEGVTCNTPCCRPPDSCQTLCCSEGQFGFGAPYDPPYTYQDGYFVAIGNADDECAAIAKRITAPTGQWRVFKAGGTHTPGIVNMANLVYKLYILGGGRICSPGGWSVCPNHDLAAWEVLPIHGDRANPNVTYAAPQNDACPDSDALGVPTGIAGDEKEAATPRLTYTIRKGETLTLSLAGFPVPPTAIRVYDLSGSTKVVSSNIRAGRLTLHTRNLAAGVYFFQLSIADLVIHNGKIVVY